MGITPIHGVPTSYQDATDTRPIEFARPRHRQRTDWAKWITLGMAAAAMLVALVVWAQSGLDGKASSISVMDVQLRLARVENDLAWIKTMLSGIARQTGAPNLPPSP
jgi:ABC-type uncharacterized transport system fused permease/ATPase subunit